MQDLTLFLQSAHFAAVRLSNELLFKFAYQVSGKLNDEEQKDGAQTEGIAMIASIYLMRGLAAFKPLCFWI